MKVLRMNRPTGPLRDNLAGVSDMLPHFPTAGSGDEVTESSSVKGAAGRNWGRRCSSATFSGVSSAHGSGLRAAISDETVLLRWSLSHSLLLPSVVSADAGQFVFVMGWFKNINS